MRRDRIPLSALEEWAEADAAAEEETIHIDEYHALAPQQVTNSALLNSMPVQKQPRGSTATPKAKEEEVVVANVFLDTHYHKLYNEYVRMKCHSEEEDDEGEDEEEEDCHSCCSSSASHEEQDEEDLFASLFGPSDGVTKKKTTATTTTKKKKKKTVVTKKRKLDTAKEYDSLRRPECFLCAWGNKFHDGIKAKHVNRLMDIMDEYGKCSNIELAGMLHLYFKHKVYKPEEGMGMLTKEVALEHIEGLHSLSASIFVGESIRKWKKVFFGFENALFKENGKYDEKAFDKLEKSQKILIMLYKLKIEELNFSLGKSSDDTRRIAQPFNLMEEMKQTKATRKRVKKKRKLDAIAPLLPSTGFDT